MQTINLVQGVTKTIVFTITDEAGDVVDVSGATCSLSVRRDPTSTEELFAKVDADFDKSDGANGNLKVDYETADLNFSGKAFNLLTTILSLKPDINISKVVVQPIGTLA